MYKDGEPFLNKRFADMVAYAKKSGDVDYIDTTTNGTFLSPDRVGPVLEAGIDKINISVDGMSPIEAAAVAIDTHNAAAGWNKALLDNAARPSGALVYAGADGAVLTDAQHERIKQSFAEQYQGAANAGRPLVLEGGLDWKAMSLSPRDMLRRC